MTKEKEDYRTANDVWKEIGKLWGELGKRMAEMDRMIVRSMKKEKK